MSRNKVSSKSCATSRALSLILRNSGFKNTVSAIALGLCVTFSSSSKRGTPRVMLLFAATPAKWKVLSVICVDGSPILCAAMIPTNSPGCAQLCQFFITSISHNVSNANLLKRSFMISLCGAQWKRRSAFQIP